MKRYVKTEGGYAFDMTKHKFVWARTWCGSLTSAPLRLGYDM